MPQQKSHGRSGHEKSEERGQPQHQEQRHTVDLNKADKEELMSISGIGNEGADAIIKYREEHGRFKNVEELQNIPGIREKRMEQLKDNFKVR